MYVLVTRLSLIDEFTVSYLWSNDSTRDIPKGASLR